MNRNRQALRNWATRLAAARFGFEKNRIDRKSPIAAAWELTAVGVGLILVLGVCARPAFGQLADSAVEKPAERIAWKTGPALERELAAPLSLLWNERESRDALNSLSRSTSVADGLRPTNENRAQRSAPSTDSSRKPGRSPTSLT